MTRLRLIVELYLKQRRKKHGVRNSRRMSLVLAISAWAIATKRVWPQLVIYFWLPMWMKTSWRERDISRMKP